MRGEQFLVNLQLASLPRTPLSALSLMLNGTRQREYDDEDGVQDAGKRLNVQQAEQGPGHYVSLRVGLQDCSTAQRLHGEPCDHWVGTLTSVYPFFR